MEHEKIPDDFILRLIGAQTVELAWLRGKLAALPPAQPQTNHVTTDDVHDALLRKTA